MSPWSSVCSSLAKVLIGLLDFLLLCSENSLYILDTVLSNMRLQSISSQSVASVSILLIISHRANISDEVPFICFCMNYVFGVTPHTSLPSTESRRISYSFF